jgi:hypothetical protein
LQIDNSRLVSLGVKFDICLSGANLEVQSGKVRGFGRCGIDFGQFGGRGACFFGAPDPDIVRESNAEEVVPGIDAKDGTEAIFEVILTDLA